MLVAVCLMAAWVIAPPALGRDPTNEEQLLVEYINRMRMNPAAELHKLVNITISPPAWGMPRSNDPDVTAAINYFNVSASTLVTQWSALVPAPPVAWNGALGQSSLTYSHVMIANNAQAHNLDQYRKPDGSPDLIARFQASGYVFAGGGLAGENIFSQAESVNHAHAAFAIDWGCATGQVAPCPPGIQNPPGHRNLIMDARMREVGVAIVHDSSSNTNTGPLVVTEHFAQSVFDGPFLTGVAYADANADQFYSIGEGLGGIRILATRQSTGVTYSTTTFASGGYALEVPTGLYNVVASGPGIGQMSFNGVVVGSVNLKLDFIPTAPPIPGDANMDRIVDGRDLVILNSNLGRSTNALWGQGDFNFDGRVSLTDLSILASRLAPPAGSPADLGPTTVPEPTSAAILAFGAAIVAGGERLRRKRRRGSVR